MTQRDAEQVRRAQSGDRSACGALVDAYQGMVFATALNVTGNYTDAEDVVQDSFLRAFQRLHTLTDPLKFPAWLRTVTRRAALQLLRKKHHVSAETLEESREDGAESPAEAYARAEFARLLWHEVAELPPKTREAILLFYMEGYSVKRAAAYLDCSESALKTRLHFGREKLREALLVKVEAELRDHHPTQKHRNAILAALPPSVGAAKAVLGTGGTGVASSAFFLTPASIAAMAVVALLITGLVTLAFWPKGTPPADAPANLASAAIHAESEQTTDHGVPAVATAPEEALQAALQNNAPVEQPKEGGATLSGRVLDADTQEGIPHVEVTLRGGKTRLTATTDASGAFRFEGLPPQRYRVFCGKAKGYYELEHGELQEVELAENQHFEGLDFALEPGVFASLSGTVLMPDGSPAKGAKVAAFKEFSAPGRNHHVECTTREDGSFLAEELPVGAPIYVSAGAPGFHSRREGPLVLSVEGLEGVTLHLYPAGSISGVVVDKTGRPISDSDIGVKGTRWEHYEGGTAIVDERTQTKVDGTFLLGNLQAGGYSLIAETEPNAIMYTGLWMEPEPEDLIQVAEGQHVTGITLVFDYAKYKRNKEAEAHPEPQAQQPVAEPQRPSRRGRIEGQVVRADSGEPVTSFRLSTNQDGRYAEAIKHPEGRFCIEKPEDAKVTLTVTAEGFAPARAEVEVPEDSDETVQVVVRMEAACVVEGIVVDWDGNPVAGAVIYLDELGDRYSMDNRADAQVKTDGTFRLDSLTPGVHRIFAVHPEFAFAWADVEARAGRPTDVTIPLARGGTIEGAVTRDGQSVNEVWVRALDDTYLNWPNLQQLANELTAKRITRLYGRTDASGAYTLTNLPPGRYLLATNTEFDTMQETARRSGAREFIEAIVEPGMVTHVDLTLP